MKEVKAYLRVSKMDDVVHGLEEIGVKAMSIIPVEGIGALADPERKELSLAYVKDYSTVYKLELVCRDDDTDRILCIIAKLARTGSHGDGVIFVSQVERAVKIRTGEEGEFTLDSTDRTSDDDTD